VTRDDLKTTDDLWPVIQHELSRAILDAAEIAGAFFQEAHMTTRIDDELEEKFRRGEAEHKREWLDMTDKAFSDAIREELLDVLNYAAMVRVLRHADQEANS